MHSYPKRLIEVDLPIKQISAHARREKSIRHGHISTLHIWWARRPLAACRAVICAALWPDPADPLCPPKFREDACRLINAFAAKAATDKTLAEHCSHDTWKKWQALAKSDGGLDFRREAHWNVLRFALLDFIADFADWDNATVSEYINTSRALTQAAHEAMGGTPGTRPLVVDPFAGGGSIPLEALRVGADAFASDLNPVPVLLNKVVLEYIPKYGQDLADEVRKRGEWIKHEAEKELAKFFPKDADGATPIAYLWARTIQCEGPGCGAEVPLMRSLWLAKKASRSIALQILPNAENKSCEFRIIVKNSDGWVTQDDRRKKVTNPDFSGTMRGGSATCPCCGYSTPNSHIRAQLSKVKGGAATANLVAIVVLKSGESGRHYRLPTEADETPGRAAAKKINDPKSRSLNDLSIVPDELIPRERPSPNARGLSAVTRMGVETFGDLFTPRQTLTLTTLSRHVSHMADECHDGVGFAAATCLALALGRCVDNLSSLVTWTAGGEFQGHTFSRQALSIVWDFAEVNPFANAGGSWLGAVEWVAKVIEANAAVPMTPATVALANAAEHPLPDNSVAALITDPPYYDAVPYADLSKYFYVWLKRTLGRAHPELFSAKDVPTDEEAIWNPSRIYSKTGMPKDERFYESQMLRAFAEARRVVAPNGIGVIVFAHKTTAGWEAVLGALIEAGWTATGSWPIDTERDVRTNAMGTASLASSVHIVVRPRETPDGSVSVDEIGDWRDVLRELPARIHQWMPRLAAEGVVGADAIFACLGPALEIFSRYGRVEKASGDIVSLKEYLEQVWAAVAKEALTMIFTGADTSAFEEDARLTAMWLWTLNAGKTETANGESVDEEESDDDSEGGVKAKTGGFVLEYDAARKIAQGLGAHLEDLGSLVEVSGDEARLLPVGERARHLFGKDEGNVAAPKKKKKVPQLDLFKVLEEVDGVSGGGGGCHFGGPAGTTPPMVSSGDWPPADLN
jgi:putative DNA methylase